MAAASARPRLARHPLIRRRIHWPPTPEELYQAINLPPGFRKELSLGGLRIGHPDRRIDQRLLDLADRLAAELPYQLRLNIYAGQLVVAGFPSKGHDDAVFELLKQLWPSVTSRGWKLSSGSAVVIPRTREHIGPDLMVVRDDAPTFDEAYCGEGVPLVAEVTSPGRADRDYVQKRAFYGRAGVAIYLIVDLQQREVVMHTRPHNSGYADTNTFRLGEPLALPKPFEITLETGALPRPEPS